MRLANACHLAERQTLLISKAFSRPRLEGVPELPNAAAESFGSLPGVRQRTAGCVSFVESDPKGSWFRQIQQFTGIEVHLPASLKTLL